MINYPLKIDFIPLCLFDSARDKKFLTVVSLSMWALLQSHHLKLIIGEKPRIPRIPAELYIKQLLTHGISVDDTFH